MRFYLIVLSMAGLIMMRQVIHLSTFQPPVHNASLDALWPVKDFYRKSEHLVTFQNYFKLQLSKKKKS